MMLNHPNCAQAKAVTTPTTPRKPNPLRQKFFATRNRSIDRIPILKSVIHTGIEAMSPRIDGMPSFLASMCNSFLIGR